MAMQIEKVGIELAAIYRPLNNVFLNKTMENIRTENICKNQIKKGKSGIMELVPQGEPDRQRGADNMMTLMRYFEARA